MGSACCVAGRGGDVSIRFERNTRQSPSWSCINDQLEGNTRQSLSWSSRWDSRRRVAGNVEDYSVEMKRSVGSNKRVVSDGGSLHESFGSPRSSHHSVKDWLQISVTDTQVKDVPESPATSELSAPKVLFSMDSSSPSSIADTLSTSSHPLPVISTPSGRDCISPGHRLLRQISDSRIHGLKSPGDYSLSEGRPSSQGGSSEGWSTRTFSELVASSQRERWSFESEVLSNGFGKISGCSSRFSCSPSLDVQTCGACSKVLLRNPSRSNGALMVVAVLVCGHAYHADCLESMTLEVDRYDPACSICLGGEKQLAELYGKASKTVAKLKEKGHRIPKGRVTDSCFSCDFGDHYKHAAHTGEIAKVGTSTFAASPSTKPFLQRHFSFGSRWSRSLSESKTRRKKGFWSVYR